MIWALTVLGLLLWAILHTLRVLYLRPLQVRYTHRPSYGYIYFFRGKGEFPLLVKIGRSKNYITRLKQHKTSNPFGVHVYGVLRVKNDTYAEKTIHQKFIRCRVSHNNEWFWLTPRLWLYILLVRDNKLTKRARIDVCTSL